MENKNLNQNIRVKQNRQIRRLFLAKGGLSFYEKEIYLNYD